MNEELRKKAKEIFMKSCLELPPFNQETLFDVMLSFAYTMCELQKQECLKSGEVIYEDSIGIWLDNGSILNCKNVCDES